MQNVENLKHPIQKKNVYDVVVYVCPIIQNEMALFFLFITSIGMLIKAFVPNSTAFIRTP